MAARTVFAAGLRACPGLTEIRRAVQAEAPGRLRHIRGTALMARRVARRYGLASRAAVRAAWLHDAAREWPAEKMLAQPMPDWLARVRDSYLAWDGALLHAPAAAAWAMARGLCGDEQILHAVAVHPTGAPGMSPLAQMLFVADYCEPTRRFPEAAALRLALAGLTLPQAVARVAREKTQHVAERRRRVHPWALALLAEAGPEAAEQQ